MPRNSAPDELLSILFALNVRAGLSAAQALGSAREAIRILGQRWAGERIYWPATDLAEARAERDAQIRELAASLSLAEVGERFGLSCSRVSEIVSAGDVRRFALPTEVSPAASPPNHPEEVSCSTP